MKIIKPSIVLVSPQLPENIGMVARAMDNFGLTKLYIVNPREGWPNNLAIKSSANSKKIILNAKIYNNLDKALDSFHYVIATSNRGRFLNKPSHNNVNRLFIGLFFVK
ncbi:RNA methyltransferase [Alphaproteobacteria bacterium]|nr:RNA methyltransferase [Alphaproteobacteria bacterium]